MEQKAWVISVNMGYGHQRTAYPLKLWAPLGRVINANDYDGIPKKDRRIWEGSRAFYEFISNFKRILLVGNFIFSAYNHFQEIFSFYPKKDASRPNFQLKQLYPLIKRGWGKDLIERLEPKSLPFITTFFVPAFMAERFGWPGEIFCVICDADMARAWAPFDPSKSRIKYLAPTERVVERLKLYGVKEENIFLTGYPLPVENVASSKDDLKNRIPNLDPQKQYLKRYRVLVDEQLGCLPEKPDHVLTILFSVGGAGSQKEIGIDAINGLLGEIKSGGIRFILSAGRKESVKRYFEKNLDRLGLQGSKNIEIIFERDADTYFEKFNQVLRKTDILWTKPSELSFYAALGLPLIISPPIGYQEDSNMRWLLKSGFGIEQGNPRYIEQWFFDWLRQGYFAEAAMQGFVEGERFGFFNIEKIIFQK